MREIKKIVSVFTLVATIFIFGSLVNKAEASEYYCGGTIQYSNSNGASGEFGGAHRSNPYTIDTNMFNYCCKYLGY